ncbi:MAG TPA: TrkH family potassium uptake protein, partial [Corynebacterium sp.]|uniref:potassium transporter TrkG n=1 Tax=Corynebacterium sp. TaxID=1720 RepID=UPI001817AA27
VAWVVRATVLFTAVVEVVVATVLTLRFHWAYGYGWPRAAWEGVFHAISGFNNAGFALYTDNVVGFASDAWVLLPLAFALMIGGIGFPVLLETARRARSRFEGRTPRRWSLTARFTWGGTALLVPAGTALVAPGEWRGALGHLGSAPTRLLNAFFAGVSPRTAGFNAVDYADFHPSTLLGTDVLMFLGGGSGGTAGGVKITTAAVLIAAIVAEVRGDGSVISNGRRLGVRVVRQSLAVLAAALVLVTGATMALLILAPQFTSDQILFEVTSAFATVGLSTGITGQLPVPAQMVLVALMFAGRVGPLALAGALAARGRGRLYDYPEERPFIG